MNIQHLFLKSVSLSAVFGPGDSLLNNYYDTVNPFWPCYLYFTLCFK